MKAAIYTEKGKFGFGDVEDGVVGKNQLKVAVQYCGICGTDIHYLDGDFEYRIKEKPGIPGHECSCVVLEVGEDVKNFKVGDPIVVKPLEPCGECQACKMGYDNACMKLDCYGIEFRGSFAEHYIITEDVCHHIPNDMNMLHAALVEPMSVGCHVNRRADVKSGENVVVLGGGPIGIVIAVVAKSRGANVIVSELNSDRIAAARSMGFDVINPKETDVVEYVKEKTNGKFADTVFEVAGVQASVDTMVQLLHTHSKIIMVAAHQKPITLDIRALYMKECELITSRTCNSSDMDEALEIIAKNEYDWDKFIEPTIFPLSKIQDAMMLAKSGKGGLKVMVDCQKFD